MARIRASDPARLAELLMSCAEAISQELFEPKAPAAAVFGGVA
jgi:hypothetical protein